MNDMMKHIETATKSRLAEVIEARTKLRDAVQTSNAANVIWWDKELRLRQACLREWQNRADWATVAR